MGLGPDVPIPGSRSGELKELDEVGAAVVERAGVGVRMEEEEEEEGCTERGVRVAKTERVCVHVCVDVHVNHYIYIAIIINLNAKDF